MSIVHRYIINQKARALSEGIKIVRDVLKSNPFPNGFTTSQLFQVAVQQPPPPDFPTYRHTAKPPVIKPNKDRFRKAKPIQPWAPSHPEHPIRSIRCVQFFFSVQYRLTSVHGRFLKGEVLPVLEQSSEIRMVRQPCLTPVSDIEKPKKGRDPGFEFVWKVVDPNEVPPPRRYKPKKEVVGREVGVDLDYGHLNNRRQNARVGKITRDVETMKSKSLPYPWRRKQTKSRDRRD